MRNMNITTAEISLSPLPPYLFSKNSGIVFASSRRVMFLSGSVSADIGDLSVTFSPKSDGLKSVLVKSRSDNQGNVKGVAYVYGTNNAQPLQTENVQLKITNPDLSGVVPLTTTPQLAVSVSDIADNIEGTITSSGSSGSVDSGSLFVTPSNFRFAMTEPPRNSGLSRR